MTSLTTLFFLLLLLAAPPPATLDQVKAEPNPERRARLKEEFTRAIARTKSALAARPDVHLLVLRYEDVIHDPQTSARLIANLAGGTLDLTQMTAVVDTSLHRNRRPQNNPRPLTHNPKPCS